MKNITIVLLGATSLFGVACTGPRMVPPADVAKDSRILDATERSSASGMLVDESFKLGTYAVADVDRDATSKSGFSIGGYGKDSTTTGYSYKLEAGKTTYAGSCASIAKEQGVGNFSWGQSSELVCECRSGDDVVQAKVGGKYKHDGGEVTYADVKYSLAAVDETDSSNLAGGPAGFRVDDGDTPIGAVEVLHPGRVWLAKSVSDEDAARMSCVFAGLMLYQPPSDH